MHLHLISAFSFNYFKNECTHITSRYRIVMKYFNHGTFKIISLKIFRKLQYFILLFVVMKVGYCAVQCIWRSLVA